MVDLFLCITLILKFSFTNMFMGIIKPNLVNKLLILVFGEVRNQFEVFSVFDLKSSVLIFSLMRL